MNQKILFFDIDGTIITEDERHMMPENVASAIKSAQANGHLAFINTGRVFANVDRFLKKFGFDGFVCGCGTYIRYHDKELFHKTTPSAICREVGQVARKCGVFGFYEELLGNGLDPTMHMEGWLCEIKDYFDAMGQIKHYSVDDEDFVFDKFTAWYNETSDFDTFYNHIIKNYDYIDRGNCICEVVPKGCSKATGIKYLCDYLGASINDCFAFGDSNNDLSMLTYVPNSIAMGNASPSVKDIASFITTGVEEDGIGVALKHFGLI